MVSSTMKNLGYARDNSGCFMKKPQENPSPASSIPAIPSRISCPSTAPYTRPLASLSQFKLLDQTQASTPFAPTPSTTPTKTPLLQPETLPDEEDMPTEHVELFHGDKEDKIWRTSFSPSSDAWGWPLTTSGNSNFGTSYRRTS